MLLFWNLQRFKTLGFQAGMVAVSFNWKNVIKSDLSYSILIIFDIWFFTKISSTQWIVSMQICLIYLKKIAVSKLKNKATQRDANWTWGGSLPTYKNARISSYPKNI